MMQPEGHFIYWFFIALLMIGLYGAIGKDNLVKKLIGLSIFQTAIILFYVSVGFKKNAAIPILSPGHGPHAKPLVIDVDAIINPVPHVLMLTAIVVGVATMGVALAIIQRIYVEYGTVEESEILKKVATS